MAATLVWRLTGGATNANPNSSLGGVRSSALPATAPMNNIFDNVTPSEAQSGKTEYRALDLYNGGNAAAASVSLFNSAETTSPGTTLDFGIESSPINSSLAIANESTAPVGVSFTHPVQASALTLPDIPAGSGARVWIRRVVNAGTGNLSVDQGSFTVEYA